MNIESVVGGSNPDLCKSVLVEFLTLYSNPAFGALPKSEIELLVLNMLQQLGLVGAEPQVYELVSNLRVTRSKARKLIYESGLRKSSPEQLDAKVMRLLQTPLIQKSGELYLLDVENPLVSDHLRARVNSLGFAADGSFSPSMVKLNLAAMAALIESYLTAADQAKVKKALVKAGAPDGSFNGVLKASLKKLGLRMASEAGEELVSKAHDYFEPIITAQVTTISKRFVGLFD